MYFPTEIKDKKLSNASESDIIKFLNTKVHIT